MNHISCCARYPPLTNNRNLTWFIHDTDAEKVIWSPAVACNNLGPKRVLVFKKVVGFYHCLRSFEKS